MFLKTGSPWVYFTSRAFQGYITEHPWKGVFWLSAVLELPTDWFYKDGSSFIHSALLEYIIYFRNSDYPKEKEYVREEINDDKTHMPKKYLKLMFFIFI